MKKEYEMPVAEKVQFNYTEQVVASLLDECDEVWTKSKRSDGTKCNTSHVSYND